jgi:hypothetical protein
MNFRLIPILNTIALAILISPLPGKASDSTSLEVVADTSATNHEPSRPAISYADSGSHAFNNRLIFSETPEIGRKWHGGFRTQLAAALISVQTDSGTKTVPIPSVVVDADWNCAGLLTFDIFFAGIPRFTSVKDTATHDTTTIADNFSMLTLKSRPYNRIWGPVDYKVGGGLKWYGARTTFASSAKPEGNYITRDNSISLFVTESARIFGFNYVNLYTSMALRDQKLGLAASVYPSFTLVPGYRIFVGRRQLFSLGVEYYLMNQIQFPMKSVQVFGSVNQLPIENYDQAYFGFLFYGFQFASKHVWAGLTIGNHYSFTGPTLLVFGIGCNI